MDLNRPDFLIAGIFLAVGARPRLRWNMRTAIRASFDAVHWLPCQGRTLAQTAGELA